MDALMFLLFASQVLHISGRVTVISGKQYNVHAKYERKLICVSEDDGGALVWNGHLNLTSASYKYYAIPFDYLYGGVPDCTINCKMNTNDNCLQTWSQQDWKLTSSLKTPMGPVHDQRWEEFKEYSSEDIKYEHIHIENTTVATLSVSIRASSDAHILFCNSNNYLSDLCYSIIISGWNNSASIIQKCETGILPIGNFSLSNSICNKTLVSFNHMPLSELEWRSFIIMWNSVTRNISVYDTQNVIMTYKDTENLEFLSTDYHMFIRSSPTILFRFHIYNFLHTVNKNAILTSPIAQFDDRICIQMFIGLCAECEVDITLRNSTNYNILHTVNVKSSSGTTNHGLPMWQSVLIKKNISTRFNKMIIQVIPKLNAASSNPLWAIANVRQCPRNNLLSSLRWSVMRHYQFEDINSYFWPAICQKLFYADSAIVNSILDAKPNVTLDFTNCPEEKIGPQCSIPCKYLNHNVNCKGTRICYKDGCTCPPGYLGNFCSNPCMGNTYGYGCRKICGACRNKTSFSEQVCDTVTGVCHEGCEDLYITPLCQSKIDELNAIDVTFINSTSIQAIIPFTWRKKYEEITISYRWILKGNIKYINYSSKTIFPNTTQLIGYFENLTPGVVYRIECELHIEGTKTFIHSDSKNVETECNLPDAPKNLTFTINNSSVIDLKWNHPWRISGHLQSYLVRVHEVSSNLRKQRLDRRSRHDVYDAIYKFPVTHYKRNYSKRLYLFPSTSYRIFIQAETIANVTSKVDYVEIETPSTIAFGGDLKVAVDDFNSMVILNIPQILNDTQDSKMHIIVKGPHPCEQYSEVPKSLHAKANIKMYDIAWQAAEIPTRDFASKLFTVGDNQSYGGAKNCPLKPHEQYEIVIIVIAHNSSNKPIMLAKSIHIGEVPSKHHEAWIIPILFLVLLVMGFYLYRRKKQKSTKQLMENGIVLLQNIENYQHKTKSVISNSRQELSTFSDIQSLSRSTIPEVSSLVVEKRSDEETEKEITSLTKVKNFEDYVR